MLLLTGTLVNAQFYVQDVKNSETMVYPRIAEKTRREIVLPQVNGYNVYKVDLHTHTVFSDGSASVEFRVKEALGYGITVIPGTEISRDGTTIGHYNALFIKDNNSLYDIDPLVSMRNAKAQGALIVHNHPGWRKTNLNYTEVDKVAYDEGLIDRALERDLFMLAASDIHTSTAAEFNLASTHRPMTLVLARENTQESLREALEAGRTIAYANSTLCGPEQLLKDLFLSSMTMSVICDKDSRGRTVLALTNMSSIPYMVAVEGGNPEYVGPFCTLILRESAGVEEISFEVMNMCCTKTTHPVVKMSVK